MSIRLMAEAMSTALPCSAKLVLIVLADRANDQGGSIWESVGEIARKSSLSDRQVQRTLRGFEADGLLVCVSHANGGAPGMSRRYRLNVAKLAELVAQAQAAADARDAAELAAGLAGELVAKGGRPVADDGAETGDVVSPVGVTLTTSARQTGDIVSPVRVTSTTETGDMGVTRSVIDPSKNTNTPHTPQGGQAGVPMAQAGVLGDAVGVGQPGQGQERTEAPSGPGTFRATKRPVGPKPRLTLRGYLQACQEAGRRAIAPEDAVWAYAETVGLPPEFVGLAWAELKRLRIDTDKRQADWPRVLRNAVAGNWYRLWFVAEGGAYSLTTQGQQARRWHEAAKQAAPAAQAERRAA